MWKEALWMLLDLLIAFDPIYTSGFYNNRHKEIYQLTAYYMKEVLSSVSVLLPLA